MPRLPQQPPQMPPPRDGGEGGGAEPPRPPRRFPLLLLLGLAILLPLLFQSVGDMGPTDGIRYDQFLRYVREGRVEWVHLTSDEIRGKYREAKKPAAEEGAERKERPDQFVTGRLEHEALVDVLEEHHVAFRRMPDSRWAEQWPWLLYIGVTIAFMALIWGGLFRRMGAQAGGVLSFGKSRGKVFQESDVKVTFSDVAGVDEAKEELHEIIEFLQSPGKFQLIGAKIPKGVLLLGPPGTGKTLLARAVAGEAKVPFISISGSEFVEMFVGVGAARVRDLFEQAAKSAPCIVFIDELDALGRSRGGGALGGGRNKEREKAVIIMAATNRPEVLDQALLRPGRFDRQVLVDRPDRKGREHILKVHVRKVKLDDDVDLAVVAARTPGFAGADLANLVNEAALLAARRGRERVTMNDFSAAIDRVIAGLEKKSRIITDEERKRVAFHEVGHALAGTLSGAQDTVHKISIVPRGMAALGYTMQLPSEERYLMTESAIHARLVGLLGGRTAEQLVFGETSTGAQDDLRKATDIARAMVTEYGMSEVIGPVAVSNDRRPTFLQGQGGPSPFGREFGDRLADTVDQEVRRVVEEAREKAKKLLSSNRDTLDHIAECLLEREVLEGEELAVLLEEAKRKHAERAAEAAAAE
jgi:cell division protease FtsH